MKRRYSASASACFASRISRAADSSSPSSSAALPGACAASAASALSTTAARSASSFTTGEGGFFDLPARSSLSPTSARDS
jgi:hypothetical protein